MKTRIMDMRRRRALAWLARELQVLIDSGFIKKQADGRYVLTEVSK